MKKFLLSTLAVLSVAGMAYAGNGTQADPYTVAEVVAMGNDANVPGVYVKGYIVGFINGMSYTNAVFGLPEADENQTNIILAGSTAENDIKYCLPVQLPSGNVRTDLNLWKNPDVLNHQVILGGDIIKYFGQIGIKNTKSYEWVGEAPELGTGGNTGGGSTGSGYLTSDMDNFTVEYVTELSEGLSYVWAWDAAYSCAKASAYVNGANHEADCYLVSPEFTISADAPKATFSQALNYLNGNNRADFVNVCVREGATGEWKVVNVSEWPAGSSWAFSDGCVIDLAEYAGKTIQIGFHYQSTTACGPTWEVKRLEINATAGGDNPTPEVPGELTGETVTFDFTNPDSLGITYNTEDQETDLTGVILTNGPVSLSFANNGGSTVPRLWNASGAFTMRFYKDNELTVTVGDGNFLKGIEFDGSNIGTDWTYSNGVLSGNTWYAAGDIDEVTIGKNANGNTPAIKTMTVYYSNESGVAEILAADDSEAVYFNLQGQKVNNPERGIFIKVVGGKALKVVK